MRISYQWLQSFFEQPLPKPEVIREAVTLNAFEVEGLEAKGNDAIFDIAVLPNRGHDALSHRGIAKEISTLLNIPLSRDPLVASPPLTPDSNSLSVTVEDSKLCPRYSAAVIKGVSVGPSPDWLKERLESIGQRSINNVVDATNYVMFEIGQPLHAFDMGRLSTDNKQPTTNDGEFEIKVRNAKRGESITTLDGKVYELNPQNLLIVDAVVDVPIGIAGVKGGKPAEISENTQDIIIESANFNGTSIRKTAKQLKLRTDASIRFEHELSSELAGYGLAAATELIVKIAGGTVEGYVDVYPKKEKARIIKVETVDANKLLGSAFTEADTENILKRLGFPYAKKGKVFAVTAPLERLDLNIKEDLIEEIGRVYGYGNIVPVVPPAIKPAEINKKFYYAEKIRNFLVSKGFSEVITYSFVEKEHGKVETDNPFSTEKPFLRQTLRLNLQRALDKNYLQKDLLGLPFILLFEIGTVFTPNEETHLAIGVKDNSGKKSERELTAASIILGNLIIKLGYKGGTVSDSKDDVVEINLDVLIEKLPQPKDFDISKSNLYDISYKSYSVYPFVLRDIAVFVPENTKSGEVLDTIKNSAGGLLVNSMLFDEFIPSTDSTGSLQAGSGQEKKKSYAFRLVFQSMEKTLSDDEVNVIMEKVNTAITAKSWEVR